MPAGVEPIVVSRASRADWDVMRATMDTLREHPLDLGPSDETNRLQLTEAAQDHPDGGPDSE